MKLFESFPVSEAMPISSMTFMVQLEVADRICSMESAGDNGSVTASIGLSAKAEKLFACGSRKLLPGTVCQIGCYEIYSARKRIVFDIPGCSDRSRGMRKICGKRKKSYCGSIFAET